MDMDGMDMDGMDMSGGMDMSSNTNFVATNMYIASVYWILVGAVVGLLLVRRIVDLARRSWRRRMSKRRISSKITRPSNYASQTYDTIIAIFREMSYPQFFHFSNRFGKYFSPPPLGRCLLLGVYWIVILTMLWSNTILTPNSPIYAYKWEIVGFRAAWVTVSQLPLIYCLSCKINVISLITGISYERLNWLHRWVARTLFLTAIVHWSYFFTEWTVADFVSFELQMMPMVVYGFGAWAVVGWMILSGLGFFRAKQYEFFVWQHLASAGVLLWLVWVHVPSYAAYNVWLAIAFVAFDRLARLVWTLYRNLNLPIGSRKSCGSCGLSVGYQASLHVLPGRFVSVKIPNIKFSWKPGQHIFLSVPRLGIGQSHPFTIANDPGAFEKGADKHIELYIHARAGLTKKLLRKAESAQLSNDSASLRVFVSGPFGFPPHVDSYETVVLIAASSGASFTVPIFQELARNPYCARRIFFYWVVRNSCQLAAFTAPILNAISSAERQGVELKVGIFITGSSKTEGPYIGSDDIDSSSSSSSNVGVGPGLIEKCDPEPLSAEYKSRATATTTTTTTHQDSSKSGEATVHLEKHPSSSSSSSAASYTSSSRAALPLKLRDHSAVSVYNHGRRPVFDDLLRPAVEGAKGETAVVGCGSGGFTAALRNYTGGLSDERAVHKGSGAQGVFLFTETYGW